MHLFHIPQSSIQNRNMNISVLNGTLLHSGICELGQLEAMSHTSLTVLWSSGHDCVTVYETSRTDAPIAKYVKWRVAHATGMPGTFSLATRVSDSDMHHGTCVTHVPWCMPGSLTSGFLWSRWRGKKLTAFPAHTYLVRGPWTTCTSHYSTLMPRSSTVNSFPLDKMAAISEDDIFKCILLYENHWITIQIALKFVPRCPIDYKPHWFR